MAIKTTIKKILGKAKDIGLGILRKGTINFESPKTREAIKRLQELKGKNLPEEFIKNIRKKTIEDLEKY